MLPLWIQWPQAILILVISCLGAWIAFQQVKIAKAKLNLDLYDRRFKVFEAARTCLVFVLQKADVTQEVMNALYLGTADAVFLFDKEIEEYLEKFQRQMIDFQMLNYSIKNLSPDRRGPLTDQLLVQMDTLNKELPALVAVFESRRHLVLQMI